MSCSTVDPVCTSRAPRLLSLLALTVAAFAVSGCSIILDPDPCPEVLCDAGCSAVEDEDGCTTCACEEPEPEVCFNSDDCADGQRCDTENFCESPPGCTEGAPCPAVCYGRCVAEPESCHSDDDCASGERCRFGLPVTGDGAVPSDDLREPGPDEGDVDPGQEPPPGDPPEQLPEPVEEGVCVPAECPATLALPACPPGTELVIDFENDPCGDARCVRRDDTCRGLSPDVCEQTPGCHTETVSPQCDCPEPAPGDGADFAPCECPAIAEIICVEDEGCQGLDPDACAANPGCVGEYFYGDCANADEAFCDPDDESCGAVPCQPTEEFICLPRFNEGCNSGADCPPGTVCINTSTCTEICWEAEDGTSGCEVECWEDEGYCAPSEEDCWSLSPEECEVRGDCMIDYRGVPCDCDPNSGDCGCPDIAEAVCVPRPTQSCFSDVECGPGQYCDIDVFCPDCDGDGDIDCAAPCFVEGVCRDGGPPPAGCTTDDECGMGYHCESVTVCEDCAPPDPNGNDDPCTGACWNEGICVWDGGLDGYCYSDDDCSDDAFCNFDNCLSDPTCPECDVCAFRCEPREPIDVCWSDDDCGGDRICDTVNYCEADPSCVDGEACDAVCYGRCVDPVPPDDLCLDDGDCGQGERCATELDVCLCPDGSPNCFGAICYSQCVPVEPDQICYSDEACGNGQFCLYEDPMCDPSGGGGNAPIIACEGRCAPVEMPPPTECFTDDDCANVGNGYACVEEPGCDPNLDFCPATCQLVGDCIQVITPARNPETGSCVEFSTPCDVPDGWELVMSCDSDGGGNNP